MKKTCSLSEQVSKGKGGRGITEKKDGSISDIYEWLNKKGEVMSRGKICSLLQINDKLAPELVEQIKKQSHATHERVS